MLRQFDVVRNPIRSNLRIYPYLVVLQSEVSQTTEELIIAPLTVANPRLLKGARTVPEAELDGSFYVVVVPLLAALTRVGLGRPVGTIEPSRDVILTAIDYLFFGI